MILVFSASSFFLHFVQSTPAVVRRAGVRAVVDRSATAEEAQEALGQAARDRFTSLFGPDLKRGGERLLAERQLLFTA